MTRYSSFRTDPLAALLDALDAPPAPPGPSSGMAAPPSSSTALVAELSEPQGADTLPAELELPPAPSPATSVTSSARPDLVAGDVVTWQHSGEVQFGAVQNLGADGRVWVRRLDQLRIPIPLDPAAVSPLLHLEQVRALALEALR